LSADLLRDEKVSFVGKIKKPLVFRDAMLMLREIVISDMRQKKKERVEFFSWLEEEIARRVLLHKEYLPGVRENLQKEMENLISQIEGKDTDIKKLTNLKNDVKTEIDKHDIWHDYNKIEKDFWKFIYKRDSALWMVLDPVITVHPDQVTFEAFSLDESTYGCLSVGMEEFELIEKPQLGTTNIDFSAKLAREMERFRTYTDVELSVNPGGFTVDTGVMPEYVEKKIDLPESWIKGFNQVSSAASLGGIDVLLTPTDMYDICSILRRYKANKSPRYMKWLLEPGKNVKIIFEPFGKILKLNSVYTGKRKREQKIWGRRRWLVAEKLIPLTRSFKVRFLGFGMPQFIIADLGGMKMTIGFTSWAANDWVKGTAFNVLGGFIGEGNYNEVYSLLKKDRLLSLEEINNKLNEYSKNNVKAGVGMLFRRGEGYYDPIKDNIRFRQLCNIPISPDLYESTDVELNVQKHLDEGMDKFSIKITAAKEYLAKISYKKLDSEIRNNKSKLTKTELSIDQDAQITKVSCDCKEFVKGPRNISAPCSHILALYVNATKFMHLELEPETEYKMNDILEMLL